MILQKKNIDDTPLKGDEVEFVDIQPMMALEGNEEEAK